MMSTRSAILFALSLGYDFTVSGARREEAGAFGVGHTVRVYDADIAPHVQQRLDENGTASQRNGTSSVQMDRPQTNGTMSRSMERRKTASKVHDTLKVAFPELSGQPAVHDAKPETACTEIRDELKRLNAEYHEKRDAIRKTIKLISKTSFAQGAVILAKLEKEEAKIRDRLFKSQESLDRLFGMIVEKKNGVEAKITDLRQDLVKFEEKYFSKLDAIQAKANTHTPKGKKKAKALVERALKQAKETDAKDAEAEVKPPVEQPTEQPVEQLKASEAKAGVEESAGLRAMPALALLLLALSGHL